MKRIGGVLLMTAMIVTYGVACSRAPQPDAGAASSEATATGTVSGEESGSNEGTVAMNTLTAEEEAAGWRLLFDGETTEGWRGYQMDTLPSGWEVVDGALTRVGPGGDIVTEDEFANFELALDWMVRDAGNSGIFYRATEETELIYENAPEMQVLDDAGHPNGESRLTAAGSNYGLHPAPEGVVRPAGEWNHARIVVNGNHVEHWLNGQQMVEYELGGEDWSERVAQSKFNEWPAYGQAEVGHIGLQDHGDWAAFRNIKIRELP